MLRNPRFVPLLVLIAGLSAWPSLLAAQYGTGVGSPTAQQDGVGVSFHLGGLVASDSDNLSPGAYARVGLGFGKVTFTTEVLRSSLTLEKYYDDEGSYEDKRSLLLAGIGAHIAPTSRLNLGISVMRDFSTWGGLFLLNPQASLRGRNVEFTTGYLLSEAYQTITAGIGFRWGR